MTQTLRISMETPLLSRGTGVTYSAELIRAAVTFTVPPAGAFEDGTVLVCHCGYIIACVPCVCRQVSVCVFVCVGIIKFRGIGAVLSSGLL